METSSEIAAVGLLLFLHVFLTMGLPPASLASSKAYAPGEASHNPAAERRLAERNLLSKQGKSAVDTTAAGWSSKTTGSEIKNETSDMAEMKFNKFMKDFHKEYASPQEKLKRFQIFKQNLEYIRQGNYDHRKKDGTPGRVFGINKFADLTVEEFRDLYLVNLELPRGPKLESVDKGSPKSPPGKNTKSAEKGGGTTPIARSPTVRGEGSFAPTNRTRRQFPNPAYWSYTDREYYPEVGPHQGRCMACIEVALAGALAILNSKMANRDAGLLAAQQLLDCVPGNSCQVASTYSTLVTYLMNEYLCPDRWYPYRGITQSCRDRNVERKGLVKVQNYQILDNDDETETTLISKIQQSPFLVSLKGEYLMVRKHAVIVFVKDVYWRVYVVYRLCGRVDPLLATIFFYLFIFNDTFFIG
ncbi:unnamed protein product [Bemisia tabaci]|uniref:Cathepsin propeptide inhibitor domain-containing protein n=1 Tax=Bemisia tabaci TaxID=7038 RepID=A0A9P0CAN1_BEMTA|nr:unnamed protein product [Bemisia tabaci]